MAELVISAHLAAVAVLDVTLPLHGRTHKVYTYQSRRGPLSLRIPCRVVYLIDDPDLVGFAYDTLPGHPEAGEEHFALRRHADGSLELTASAFRDRHRIWPSSVGQSAMWSKTP